jgi:signal transduction histidine kinase
VSTILTVLVACFALITTTEVAAAERARDQAERATQALGAAQEQLRQHGAIEERLRIARELHDIVGHQLAGLTLSLETARHLPPDEAQHYLDSAQVAGKELLAQVRSVVSELRDAPTEPMSLERISEAWPAMQVELTEPQVVTRLPVELRHATVRLVQEALTNAARHGGATQTWVALELSDGSLSVVVRDNGRGADAAVEGNGLRGMRERFDALDGSVVWRGMPTGGFVVQASAPVADASEFADLREDHS